MLLENLDGRNSSLVLSRNRSWKAWDSRSGFNEERGRKGGNLTSRKAKS
jgi:hypothetical protein